MSDIYFADFDKKYYKQTNISYYRFVDDILILCNNSDVKNIKNKILKDTNNLKLNIHIFQDNSDKSTIGMIDKDKFQFLGFEFYNDTVSVRESSLDNLRSSIVDIFKETVSEKELYRVLNLKITGCIYDDKQYGWLRFFALIDDMTLLYSLDAFVKSCFGRFKNQYKSDEIKKFSKTYFALKNINKSNYIPTFNSLRLDSKEKIFLKRFLEMIQKDMEFY